ncbi:hypothetical protein [Nitrosomonas sp.]
MERLCRYITRPAILDERLACPTSSYRHWNSRNGLLL